MAIEYVKCAKLLQKYLKIFLTKKPTSFPSWSPFLIKYILITVFFHYSESVLCFKYLFILKHFSHCIIPIL